MDEVMIPALNQRWNERRARYRPTGELIATADYTVEVIPDDTTAKAFVERHHYSGTYPAARFRVGLYHRANELVGVAVFSHPPSEDVLAKLPCERLAGVELGRFVLLDSVPGNGESWFLARCFELLRANGFEILLSHSDPVPRRTRAGALVMPGHVGQIYQATNAIYAGRTKPTKHVLLPDGQVFSPRAMSKIRCAERGFQNDVDKLVFYGAAAPTAADLGSRDGRRAWMWGAIRQVGRRLKHHGNHRYLWALDRKLRRSVAAMATGQAYPKAVDACTAHLATEAGAVL
jgi:hypothetical protein